VTSPSPEVLRQSIRSFLRQEVAPHVEEWESGGAWPARELMPEFGRRKLLGLEYPPRYGGMGLDFRYKRILGEELGSLDCAGIGMSVTVHTDMATPALAAHGSDEARETFLAPAVAGTAIGAIALTEPGGGSDFNAIETRLDPCGGDFAVTGRKAYLTNGSVAGFYVVLCRSAGGPVESSLTLVVLPADAPGIRAQVYRDKLGNRCCDHAEVSFDGVRIPAAYVIGEIGLGYAVQTVQFTRERLMAAVLAVAQAKRLLAAAAAEARGRHAFGRAVIDHDSVAARLAEVDMRITLVNACLDVAIAGLGDDAQATKLVLTAKIASARAWVSAADCLMQISGGRGYLSDVSIQRAYRDARSALIAAGTEETLRRALTGYLP
jgi:alkylation response protein AidB-like acyl-CoA dehydrogenase